MHDSKYLYLSVHSWSMNLTTSSAISKIQFYHYINMCNFISIESFMTTALRSTIGLFHILYLTLKAGISLIFCITMDTDKKDWFDHLHYEHELCSKTSICLFVSLIEAYRKRDQNKRCQFCPKSSPLKEYLLWKTSLTGNHSTTNPIIAKIVKIWCKSIKITIYI